MNKKSAVILVRTVILVLAFSFLLGIGFDKRTDVVLLDYSVSEDGIKLTFHASVMSSMGYSKRV